MHAPKQLTVHRIRDPLPHLAEIARAFPAARTMTIAAESLITSSPIARPLDTLRPCTLKMILPVTAELVRELLPEILVLARDAGSPT